MDSTEKMLPADGKRGAVARAVDDAGAHAHAAIDRMSETAVPAVNRMTGGAHRSVDRATQFASGTAESLATRADRLQVAQVRITDECRGYIRENPLASVGMALAAGYVLTRLFNSR